MISYHLLFLSVKKLTLPTINNYSLNIAMYSIHRFNQNYGALGMLERLHRIDNVFNLLLLLSAQKIMITRTSISKNIQK